MNLQIPDVLADKLIAEADERGEAISKIVSELLAKKYRVPLDQLPKKRRAGRKPKPREDHS